MSAHDPEVHTAQLHVHLHLDPLTVALVPARAPGAPLTAILTIGGSLKMPAQVSIDDQTGTAQLYWVDDKGDTDAPRPDGATVTFGSSDPTVITVAPDATNPDLAHLNPVKEGTALISVTITNAAGQPLMEPDGTTPFSAPPADVQVVAGAAVGAGLQIKS